jgi:hypothetical protein
MIFINSGSTQQQNIIEHQQRDPTSWMENYYEREAPGIKNLMPLLSMNEGVWEQ